MIHINSKGCLDLLLGEGGGTMGHLIGPSIQNALFTGTHVSVHKYLFSRKKHKFALVYMMDNYKLFTNIILSNLK